MVGYKRGPLCGATNPSFSRTPGSMGINDAWGPNKNLLIADRRGPAGLSSGSSSAVARQSRFKFGPISPPYTGPPYVLGKPEIANRLIRAFLTVALKTYKSRFEILTALTRLASQELRKLGIPLPSLPQDPPKDPMAAGGFSCGNDQKGYPQGVWEIKLYPAAMDLTPSEKPKEFAEQCGTVAHEYEHLVNTYYAVRFAVAKGEKDKHIAKEMLVLSRIIKSARSQPLKTNSTDYLQAEEFYWFSFFTRLDRKRSDPIPKLSRLNLSYLERHQKVKQLKRYNATDKTILEIEYNKILTTDERQALIRKLEVELQSLKMKIAAARKRYTALPKETVGHIVEEIFEKGVLKGLSGARTS